MVSAIGGSAATKGFSLSRVDEVVQTLVILGAILAVVVLVDRSRRRRRPIRPPGIPSRSSE